MALLCLALHAAGPFLVLSRMSVGRKRTLSTFLPSPLLPSNPPTRYFEGTDLISDYIFNKTTHFNEEEIIRCRLLLIKWYEENRRLLPWRGDTLPGFPSPPLPSPYGIWVSEIMLQQTRVDTVIKYWNKWMIKYPTIQDLATATPDEVNTLWSGLGYYSRAQRLLEGARVLKGLWCGVVLMERQHCKWTVP